MNKIYIGDGVYAEMKGLNLILTTEDGINVTNLIVLEPEVLDNLNQFLRKWFIERNKYEQN